MIILPLINLSIVLQTTAVRLIGPWFPGSCLFPFFVNCSVCVESIGHVIVSGDHLASGCFEWSYIISIYSSLIDAGVEAFRVSFAYSCNIDFLVAFGLLHCSFNQPSSSEVFSTGFVCVVPPSFIIGSLTSCDGLLDIIVDP